MRFVVAIGFLLLLVSCGQSTSKNQESATSQEGTIEFVFQEEMHNFGNLQAGEVVICNFKFTNTGEGNLIIEKAESECGCITVYYPEEGILPGESAYIEVEFNSSGEVGRVYKEIRIFSNAQENETVLAIVADVENELLNIYTKI